MTALAQPETKFTDELACAANEMPCARERLLAAAREVFAESGFRGATVRAICRRAGVNVAAVNYYFNSKEALFSAALDFTPLNRLLDAENSPACARARLAGFIRELLTHLISTRGSQKSQLLMHELLEPTLMLDEIVRDVISPLHTHVGQLVRAIVGPDIAPETLRRCVFSILGQCTFYRHSNEVIRRLHPEIPFDEEEIARTAAHIAEFSLAGLDRLAQPSAGPETRKP